MSKVVRYKRSLNSGDCIAELAGIKHVYDTTGKKGVILQRIGMKGEYYPGAVHPVRENGIQVCMSNAQWAMLKPLLESQEYIDHTEIWEGQPFDIDLDKHLEGNPVNKPAGLLARWNFYINPAMACDISLPWITVNKVDTIQGLPANEVVIVNRTSRYRNDMITYFFLKKWEDRIVFAGTKGEHEDFCDENKLDINYLHVDNFFQLTQYLASCKGTICNQSMIYNICDAAKYPRILELSAAAPNCFPQGANGFDFFHQGALEFYVERLFGETPKLVKQ